MVLVQIGLMPSERRCGLITHQVEPIDCKEFEYGHVIVSSGTPSPGHEKLIMAVVNPYTDTLIYRVTGHVDTFDRKGKRSDIRKGYLDWFYKRFQYALRRYNALGSSEEKEYSLPKRRNWFTGFSFVTLTWESSATLWQRFMYPSYRLPALNGSIAISHAHRKFQKLQRQFGFTELDNPIVNPIPGDILCKGFRKRGATRLVMGRGLEGHVLFYIDRSSRIEQRKECSYIEWVLFALNANIIQAGERPNREFPPQPRLFTQHR